MMKIRGLIGVAGLSLVTMAPVAAATHVYDLVPFIFTVTGSIDSVFDGTYDVTGYIETDGMLGVLAPANILSSALTAHRQDDPFAMSIRVELLSGGAATGNGSTVTMIGALLTATDTDLMLRLDPGGEIVFSDGTKRFGFRSGSITAFLDIPAQGIFAQTTVSDTDHAGIANAPTQTGQVPLPLPAWLLASAVGALTITRRTRRG